MAAGVVPRLLDVAVGATLDVATEDRGLAVPEGVGRIE
jgi:hypothetical protein